MFYFYYLRLGYLSKQQITAVYQLYNIPILDLLVVTTFLSLLIKAKALKMMSILTGILAFLVIFLNIQKFFLQPY